MNMDFIYAQVVRILQCYVTKISSSGNILCNYGDMPQENNPIIADTEFARTLVLKEKYTFPLIITENEQIGYAVIPDTGKFIVVGPVSFSEKTATMSKYILREHKMKDKNYMISYCDPYTFCSMIVVIYNVLYDKKMSAEELLCKNSIRVESVEQVKACASNIIFSHQENVIPHNPYDQERREMDSIRQGNVEMLKASLAETYSGKEGQLAENEIRQAKNIAIVVITLASRAAIEGGLLPEEAFSLVDAYISTIEKMGSSVKIHAMMRQAEFEFTERVHNIAKNEYKNELVEHTKNYLFQHMHEDIVIGEIGKHIGVNTSYLSALFRRTEGITIQQYISKEKVRLAENMLRYSEYEVGAISNYLSFCSQSYFGRVFKEQTGYSPVQYRKKFRRRVQ